MLSAPTLTHELLTLEPLTREHIPGLEAAAAHADQAPEFATVPMRGTAAQYVELSLERADSGDWAPYAQITADGRLVGHTAFLTPRRWPDSERLYGIEIGASYLHPSVQGTAINSASKLLMMTHAFEVWEVARVDIKTDARNARARAGIRAVGASFEGILRNWQPSQAPGEDGRTRDTAMHAVAVSDWPEIKAALGVRIEAKRDSH